VPSVAQSVQQLRLHLPASPRALSSARSAVDRYLGERGVGAPDRADIALIVSELCTNAVEASPEGASLEVVVNAGAARVDIAVFDDGPGFHLPAGRRGSQGVRPVRGRGLDVVRSLGGALTVSREADRTAVRCTRPLTA
jgi:anti-sigma regulatory factor (Ser/Thr protein kinase)